MKRVVIESPYAGDTALNKEYLQLCIRWCIGRGFAPFASHQMYTEALDDSIPLERSIGIAAGYAWMEAADEVFFFTDLGWSNGMMAADRQAMRLNLRTQTIQLQEEHDAPTTIYDLLSRLSGDSEQGPRIPEGDQSYL